MYRVKAQDITLITQTGKYFYSVRRNAPIQVLTEQEKIELDLSKLKIFEDQETEECAICLCEKKEIVFYPCGHYYVHPMLRKTRICVLFVGKLSQEKSTDHKSPKLSFDVRGALAPLTSKKV